MGNNESNYKNLRFTTGFKKVGELVLREKNFANFQKGLKFLECTEQM